MHGISVGDGVSFEDEQQDVVFFGFDSGGECVDRDGVDAEGGVYADFEQWARGAG